MIFATQGKGSLADGIEMNELYGGARISYIFTEIFGRSLQVPSTSIYNRMPVAGSMKWQIKFQYNILHSI